MLINLLLTALFCSTLYFPGMVFGMERGLGFIPTLLSALGGGTFGFFFYSYLGKVLNRNLSKRSTKKTRKKFTRMNKFLVKIRKGYGLFGIAFLTPIVKNPVGFYVGSTLTKNTTKLFLYMFGSMVFWGLLTCSLYFLFDLSLTDAFKSLFN